MRGSDAEKLKLYFTGGMTQDFGPEGGIRYLQPIIDRVTAQPNVEVVENHAFRADKQEVDAIAIDSDGNVFFNDDVFYRFDYRVIKHCKFNPYDLVMIECSAIPSSYYTEKDDCVIC